jgi:hypothetical protein
MPERTIELTRRKVLAGLGTVGVAGAGTGLGTSALFADEESFANNELVAGSLDLKVDWEEHYADSLDGETDAAGEVVRTDGDPTAVPDGYVGLPDPASPVVAIPDENREDFMGATAVEAFPDVLEEGDSYDGRQASLAVDDDICDLDADLDAALASPLRTRGTFAGQKTEEGDPLVDVSDVKPGDFGEVTLSFHLCGNPGYIWLRGDVVANDENDVTEPEAESPGENDTADTDSAFDGELLGAARAVVWYDDDGDNVLDDDETVIFRGTLGEALLLLSSDRGIRLDPTPGSGAGVKPPSNGGCPDDADYDTRHQSGEEVTVEDPLRDPPETSLVIPNNPKCTDFGLLQALKTDEAPEGPLEYPDTVGGTKTNEYATPYGTITVTTTLADGDGGDPIQTVQEWSIADTDDQGESWCIAKVIVKGGSAGANVYSYDNGDGNDDFTDDDDVGAKSDTDADLQTPTDQDISHVDFCVAADPDGDPPNGDDDDQECFVNSTTGYVGFAWWVPRDVGNEIQGDSVAFDLGFHAEQCRNNDGSGGTDGGA